MPRQSTPNSICLTCGESFYVKPSRLKVGKGKYCSKPCYHQRNGKIERSCLYCGKPFIRPNWAVWQEAKYCSVGCRDDYVRSLPESEREALMTGCRVATRGAKQSDEHRYKIAKTKQDRCVLSGDEAEIMSAYQAAGLSPIPLYAVHRYNIDFAFPEQMVAIEYNGGNWHNTPKKQAEDDRKTAYLRDRGWTILIFPRLDKPQANNAGNRRIAIDEIVRMTQAALHNATPKALGQ